MAYVRAEQTELDKKPMIRYAKKAGKEEGIKEGKEEGKEDKGIEIATKLKNMGLSIEGISNATDLSSGFIEIL